MRKSTLLWLLIGLVVAGVSLAYFFHNVKPAELRDNLLGTPVWEILAVVALTLLTLWLRAIRWGLILPAGRGERNGLFGLIMVGFMVNNVLPARLGEVTRVLFLWKRNKFTIAESAGSVFLERILDTTIYLSFFVIPILLIPKLRADHTLVKFAIPTACISFSAIMGLLLYGLFPSFSKKTCRTLINLSPEKIRHRAMNIGKELVSNLEWIHSPVKCPIVILLSALIVACYPAMMIVLVNSKGFGILGGMFGSAWGAIGASVPSPGYVGSLHAALKFGLVLLGIDPARAISVAVIYHAVGYLTVTIVGLFYFSRMRISFKEIGRAKEELKKEEIAE